MTLSHDPRHSVIERHLLMAQRCNSQAAQLYRQGQTEAAQRQRQLLAVFLHNALQQLPLAGTHTQASSEAWAVERPLFNPSARPRL